MTLTGSVTLLTVLLLAVVVLDMCRGIPVDLLEMEKTTGAT